MTPEQRRLRDALASVPAQVAEAAASAASTGRSPDEAPAPGAWSARDVVRHLIAVNDEVWQVRLDALAAEAFPQWPWVEPGLWSGDGDHSFFSALAAFEGHRDATIAHLDALDDAGWAETGRHATYGVLDVAGLLRIALDHDEEHVRQILG